MADLRILRRNYSNIFVELAPYEQLVSIGIPSTPFLLPLPWTYYVFTLDEVFKSFRCCFLGGSPKQIRNPNRPKLYVLPLPNVYGYDGRGQLCSPWQSVKNVERSSTQELALELVTIFWQASFGYFESPGRCHDQLANKAGTTLRIEGYPTPKKEMYEYWAAIDLKDICRQRWIKSTRIRSNPNRFLYI